MSGNCAGCSRISGLARSTGWPSVFTVFSMAVSIFCTNRCAVDLDRRIVMTPASARRLLLALDRTLREHAARFSNNCPHA